MTKNTDTSIKKQESPLMVTYKQLREKIAKEKKTNIHQVVKIEKIVVTSCLGDFFRDKKKFESIKEEFRNITLQEPVTIKAKKSVASFSLREGMDIAYKATLRKNKMMHFLYRLIYSGWNLDRNFTGVSLKSISGNKKGGYNLNFGLKDISIFPEVYKTLDRHVGIGITICTNAKTPEECEEILTGINIPFIKERKA